MSLFRVELDVSRLGEPREFHPAGSLIVDTGSEVTWINRKTLEAAGVAVEKPGRQFVTADGKTIARDIGFALLRHAEFETVDEVVFAQENDLQLLGARTLEGFNAVVEPTKRRIVAAGPIVAAGGTTGPAD